MLQEYFNDEFIVRKPQASLRSAADRRNLQNTVAVISSLIPLKMISKDPWETFSSPTLFLFFSLRETVKYSQTEFYPESYRHISIMSLSSQDGCHTCGHQTAKILLL
jgi:hypothetical protein